MLKTNLAFVTPDGGTTAEDAEPELSIVMPCLNEARTLPVCINKAMRFLQENSIDGEVVVADNGSTDGSQQIAERLGARVIHVERRGYGAALRGGIAAARGKFVIMGDSDDSYDFYKLGPFVASLREGADLVVGNRFQGGIHDDAMPFLHRYLGNPVLSWLGRKLFNSPCRDFYCGLRGFRKDALKKLGLRSEGMEFALEMLIRASMCKLQVTEVPTTLSPDGRGRAPHLKTWRDGWRSLRLYLWYSPRWLFWYPGWALCLIGSICGGLLTFQPQKLFGVSFDVHTLLYCGAAVILGVQSVLFAVLAKHRAIRAGLHPPSKSFEAKVNKASLEFGLGLGCLLFIAGLASSLYAASVWSSGGFGSLDPFQMMRTVIPAVLALILGAQLMLFSFFFGLLEFERLTAPADFEQPSPELQKHLRHREARAGDLAGYIGDPIHAAADSLD